MSYLNLRETIINATVGYTTVAGLGWDVAFCAKNAKGYINIKVRSHEYEKFVTFGYLDVANWEARTSPWCDVRDPEKVDAVKRVVKGVLNGTMAFTPAANPRGKPPGAKAGYRRPNSNPAPVKASTPRYNGVPARTSHIATDWESLAKTWESRARDLGWRDELVPHPDMTVEPSAPRSREDKLMDAAMSALANGETDEARAILAILAKRAG